MTDDDRTMIELLASARAEFMGTSVDEQTEFAAKFLCLLFDAAKAAHPEHKVRADALRRTFRGIATSPSLQTTFRESLLPDLLAAPSLAAALDAPFSGLVRELSLEEDA
ncbi:MAG: hypothetical protein ABIW94_11175 [Gemmatimonadaceae bacterium]